MRLGTGVNKRKKEDYVQYVMKLYLENEFVISFGQLSPLGYYDIEEAIKHNLSSIEKNPRKWHKQLNLVLEGKAKEKDLLESYQQDAFEKAKAKVILRLLDLKQTKASLFEKVAKIETMEELNKFRKSLKI